MDRPEPFMLHAYREAQLDRIESDQSRLRRILSEVSRLIAEAQELIESTRQRTRH